MAAPALIAWVGEDNADSILSVATATMIVSAAIVEITFVDTRPEGHRTQRMSRVVSDYLLEGASSLAEVAIEGARDLAEVCFVCGCGGCCCWCWGGRMGGGRLFIASHQGMCTLFFFFCCCVGVR